MPNVTKCETLDCIHNVDKQCIAEEVTIDENYECEQNETAE